MSKILIVEDNKDIAYIYKSELEFNKFEVQVISGASMVFDTIESYKPDLVLLDLLLPDGYGIDVLKKIRSEGKYNNIKIIIISNIDASAVVNEAYASGADGYIIKSVILPAQLTEELKGFLK